MFLFLLVNRTKAKWNLKTLESCERVRADVLRLNFDTIKKDRKERFYKVEHGLCQVLKKKIKQEFKQAHLVFF